MTKIVEVHKADRISITAKLAREIWNEHYVPIIGQEQVDYMLEKFQSKAAIGRYLRDGQEYFLIEEEGKALGYMALLADAAANSLMISKIYVKQSAKGRGLGSLLLEHAQKLGRNKGLDYLWLTVNKYNDNSIAWYQSKGFEIVEELVMDIGKGYVMDDYRMVLSLPKVAES